MSNTKVSKKEIELIHELIKSLDKVNNLRKVR